MSSVKKSASKQEIDFDALIVAVKACILDKLPVRATTRRYGIARSSLQRYIDKVNAIFSDLSVVNDDDLMEFVRLAHARTPSNMVGFL